TAGTFINGEGLWQSFGGASRPLGEVRPAWKVLRVLGNLLKVNDFDYMSCDEVRQAAENAVGEPRGVAPSFTLEVSPQPVEGFTRVAETALYGTDGLVRRAPSLQATADALRQASVNMSAADAARLGVADGMEVVVRQGELSVTLPVRIDAGVPDGTVFIA